MTLSHTSPPGLRRLRRAGVATTLALTMTMGFGSAALAAPAQQAAPEADPTASSNPSDVVAKATIDYTGEQQLTADSALRVPVTVAGDPGQKLSVHIAHAPNSEAVEGTETAVTIGEDGTAQVEIDASALTPGTFAVTSADQLKRSDETFTVTPAAEAEKSPEGTGEKDQPQTHPGIRDDELDKYYPKLAKKMFDADGDGTYEITPPAPGGKGAGAIPSGLNAFYNQKIDFSKENCTDLVGGDFSSRIGRPAQCGYAIVPVDAKNPAAGQIAVAVMKVPAGTVAEDSSFTPNTKPKGSVLWNPGGPGASGMTLSVAGALDEPDLAAEYDMIGFDPRGTGASMPFSQCSTDEQIDADRASNPHGRESREDIEAEMKNQIERFAADCFANTGKAFGFDDAQRENLIKHLGTWDAVGDMDLLRSVVGDEKLNFIGFSYGTRLGYVYSQKFGSNVGRLVLDGAVDPGNVDQLKAMQEVNAKSEITPATPGAAGSAEPSDDEQDSTINQGAGFQNTFEQFALDCSAKGAQGRTWGEVYPAFAKESFANEKFSCALGDGLTDTKKLTAENARLLQTLESTPLPTGQPSDNRMVSFSDGRTGVIQALYSETLWPQLALGLSELKEGKTAGVLMALADQYNDRDEQGHYAPMLQAFTNIRCTDENGSQNGLPPIEDARKFVEAYDKAAPFQASSKQPGEYDYCDFWKFKGTLPGPEKLDKVPNILVVSTTHDSATPYASGVKLARTIDGTLLSVSGASHTSYMSRDKAKVCTDETVNDFLINGRVPKEGEFGPTLDKPDTAVDDRGSTITMNTRCKIETFRGADFSLSTKKAHAGERVIYNVRHKDDVDDYTVRFDGTEVASGATDAGGNAAGQLTVPASAKPGSYEVTLNDAAGKVAGTAFLEVMSDDDPKGDDDEGNGGGDTEDNGDGQGQDDDGAGTDGKGSDSNADRDRPLPRTGAELMPYLLLILALIGGGTALVHRSRRSTGGN